MILFLILTTFPFLLAFLIALSHVGNNSFCNCLNVYTLGLNNIVVTSSPFFDINPHQSKFYKWKTIQRSSQKHTEILVRLQ